MLYGSSRRVVSGPVQADISKWIARDLEVDPQCMTRAMVFQCELQGSGISIVDHHHVCFGLIGLGGKPHLLSDPALSRAVGAWPSLCLFLGKLVEVSKVQPYHPGMGFFPIGDG